MMRSESSQSRHQRRPKVKLPVAESRKAGEGKALPDADEASAWSGGGALV